MISFYIIKNLNFILIIYVKNIFGRQKKLNKNKIWFIINIKLFIIIKEYLFINLNFEKIIKI